MDVLLVLEGWVEDRGNVSRRGPHTDSGSGLKGGAAANRGTALHQWAFSTSVHVHARAARRNTIGGQKRQPLPLTYKKEKGFNVISHKFIQGFPNGFASW